MAINLLGNLNINTNVSNVTPENIAEISHVQNAAVKQFIAQLLPGQILEGQLVSQDGESLQLLLNNNMLLNTTVDSQTTLSTGQNISFEIKSNTDGQLTLRPLHTNVSNDATAVKALENASVRVSDETIKMVDTLMKEGMSINKETLQSMNRAMNMYPEADIEDIVLLNKLELPVNETNLNEMHLYNNNNQWMMENVSEMADDFIQLIVQASEGDMGEYTELINELGKIFADNSGNEVETVKLEANNETQAGGSTDKIIISEKNDNQNENVINKNIFDILKNVNPQRFKNHAFVERVKNELLKELEGKFLMEPEKVADKEYVRNYYNKVLDTAKQIEQLLTQGGKTDSAVAKDVVALKDNVSFMNQLNDLYNYVQLPLKMADGQANGDLYVYAKKRNGRGEEEQALTALLHLSMETLGNMDIFLRLEEGKLSTRFSLEKEEMIDFIEEHIDELNVRLINKGYDISTTVGKMDDTDKTVIDNIKNETGQTILISSQSFDARA